VKTRTHGSHRRWIAILLVAAVVGVVPLGSGTAGASTDKTTLSGEGGTFLGPVVTKLVDDSASNLDGLFGSYVANGLEPGITDFIGSGPNNFGADFDVSERPLTTTEVATAKANGRSIAYVPFAATPVAIGTLVTGTNYGGEDPIDPSSFCPHINLTVNDLGAVYGIDTAQPVVSWADSRFSCSNGIPLATDDVQLASNDDPTMANYALMALLDSDPTAKGYFAAGVLSAYNDKRAVTSSTTPSERLPYLGPLTISGGDGPFLDKLLDVNATTNVPQWAVGDPSILGFTFPVSSVWTGAPLGAAWNIPTAAIQNAEGAFVAPSSTSAAAAEVDATLAASSDPTQNNLVTFNPSTSDAAAYNNYLMEESYLVVPTNGLPANKDFALADLIRFVLGPKGQHDITSFGAAPATTAMVTAGLQVAGELDAEGAASAAGTTGSTTTTTGAASTSTTTTAGAAGAGAASSSGSGSTGNSGAGGTGATSGSNLAFTGAPDLIPMIGIGVLLLVAGAVIRRRLRRRSAQL
jgi:ABC-type phosphate transport system substrate-binding protein